METTKKLTKNDYLIILGDTGICWDGINGESSKRTISFFSNKPYTTLFIDGNHDNFDVLNSLKEEMWHGGRVHIINDSIIHLIRGEIYTINNKKLFVMGGGLSIDKCQRTPHLTWWEEELPTLKEYNNAIDNLKLHNNKVDFILTHAAPYSMITKVIPNPDMRESDLMFFLNKLYNNTEFAKWYCGHLHKDIKINDKFSICYNGSPTRIA